MQKKKQARKQLAILICMVKDRQFSVPFTRCRKRAATCYCEHQAELKRCVQSSLTCSYLTHLFLGTTSIVVTLCASGQAHFCTRAHFSTWPWFLSFFTANFSTYCPFRSGVFSLWPFQTLKRKTAKLWKRQFVFRAVSSVWVYLLHRNIPVRASRTRKFRRLPSRKQRGSPAVLQSGWSVPRDR